MSEVQECSSVGSVSVDNTTNNNENDQSKMTATLVEAENEILPTVDGGAVKVEDDIPKLNGDLKIESESTISGVSNISANESTISGVSNISENESTISGVSNISENDLILKPLSDTVPIKDKSHEVCEGGNALICKLEEEVKERTNERDMYQRKLAEVEKKLTDLEVSVAKTIRNVDNNEESVSQETLIKLKKKLTETIMQLKDRGVIMANQERQITALNVQVSTLKEVVTITKDLLEIRNNEVEHLQAEVDNMEARIAEERQKHNTMMSRMDDAVRLNSDLKKEYETQLNLFKDLRNKYDEKITLLSEGNRALELSNQPAAN